MRTTIGLVKDRGAKTNPFRASIHKNGCGGSISPPTARSASKEPKAKLFPQGRNRLPFTHYDTRHKASDQPETQFGAKLRVFWPTFTVSLCEPLLSLRVNWRDWKNRHILRRLINCPWGAKSSCLLRFLLVEKSGRCIRFYAVSLLGIYPVLWLTLSSGLPSIGIPTHGWSPDGRLASEPTVALPIAPQPEDPSETVCEIRIASRRGCPSQHDVQWAPTQ